MAHMQRTCSQTGTSAACTTRLIACRCRLSMHSGTALDIHCPESKVSAVPRASTRPMPTFPVWQLYKAALLSCRRF